MALRVAGLLVLYNNLLPFHDQLYVPLNLTVALLLILWARGHGFSWRVLGFSSSRLVSALKWSIPLGLLLPTPVFLAAVLPESLSSLANARN